MTKRFSFANRDTLVLCIILFVKLLVHFFIVNSVYDLQRDEYLHLDQGHHLALGYVSVPPFTSWTSWLILHSGHTDFLVRFFPAFWGACTIAAAWHITKALGGNLFAKTLTGIALLFSVLLRMDILYQPNACEIMDWTLVFLFLIKYILTQKNSWLYYLAITFATGFLNKYNIGFLGAGIFAGLLLTQQRKIFLNRHLYFAAGIAFLIILPNLLWQWQNNFPVVSHMKELAETQLIHNSVKDFLLEQLLSWSGPAFIIIAALIGFFFYRPFAPLKCIGISYLTCLVLFSFYHAKGYYLFGAYPALIAIGSVYLSALATYPRRRFIRPLSFVLVLLIFIPMRRALPLLTPEKIHENKKNYQMLGMLRWEDGKEHELPQDFADMLGWKELAAKTEKLYNSLPDKENTVIICDNYGEAGAINYYSNIKAYSFNADYVNWFDTSMQIKNMIRVVYMNDSDFPNDYRGQPMFKSAIAADSITNENALEKGTHIWLLKENITDIKKIIIEEIARNKK